MSLEPETLTMCFHLRPEPLEQMMNGSDADHCCTRLRCVLIVFAQGPVTPLPGIGALHHPTHWQWLEGSCPFRPAHDLQVVGTPGGGQPVIQFVVVVLVVGEDHAQTREVPAAHLGKDILSGPGIVYIRSRDHDGDEKPQGIHENMPLAALDLLAAVRAPLLATQGRLDRLTVESGSAGRRCPPGLDAGQGTQGVEDLLPGTVPVPPLEVVVD